MEYRLNSLVMAVEVKSAGQFGRTRGLLGSVLVAIAVLALAACSDGYENSADNARTKEPKTSTSVPRGEEAYEIGLPEDPDGSSVDFVALHNVDDDDADSNVDDEDLVPEHAYVAYESVIDQGVERDVWTEAEGVIAVLEILLGERPESAIDVWNAVTSSSFSGVVSRAVWLLDEPSVDDATKDELSRLLSVIAPPIDEVFPELAGDNAEPSRQKSDDSAYGGELVRIQLSNCVTPAFDKFASIEARDDVECWKVISRTTNHRLRVIFPEGLEDQAQVALEAMVATDAASQDWGAQGGPASLLITPARNKAALGLATVNPNVMTGDECVISMFAGEFARGAGGHGVDFGQVVAHEQVHCHQFASFGNLGDQDWVVEAIAELYSHLVVPDGGVERLLISHFMTGSLVKSLDQMSYENWVWWQYMVNHSSPAHVWELQGRLLRSGLQGLAAEPGIAEAFHNFTIDLVSAGIPTRSAPIPPFRMAPRLATISSEQTVSTDSQQFVASRHVVHYKAEHLFTQEDRTETDGITQLATVEASTNRASWAGLPPEVRSRCDKAERYIVVSTITKPETHTFTFDVTEAEKYGCDSCLGGTWVLDNETFANAINQLVAAEGLPPGASARMELIGDYFYRFDGAGSAIAWRDNYEIRNHVSASGMNMTLSVFVDSIETSQYGADGERFTAWDAVTVDYLSRMEMPGMGIGVAVSPDESVISAFGGTFSGPGGGLDPAQRAGGTYTCTKQSLELVLDAFADAPIRFTRVAAPPEPPVVLAP
ncbi:MAG: hypothetical protein WC184_08445 [Acidimicrobiia bacterium]